MFYDHENNVFIMTVDGEEYKEMINQRDTHDCVHCYYDGSPFLGCGRKSIQGDCDEDCREDETDVLFIVCKPQNPYVE